MTQQQIPDVLMPWCICNNNKYVTIAFGISNINQQHICRGKYRINIWKPRGQADHLMSMSVFLSSSQICVDYPKSKQCCDGFETLDALVTVIWGMQYNSVRVNLLGCPNRLNVKTTEALNDKIKNIIAVFFFIASMSCGPVGWMKTKYNYPRQSDTLYIIYIGQSL